MEVLWLSSRKQEKRSSLYMQKLKEELLKRENKWRDWHRRWAVEEERDIGLLVVVGMS